MVRVKYGILFIRRISPKCIQDTSPKYVTISTRPITDNNILKFKFALQCADWSDIDDSLNANQAYDTFVSNYLNIYDGIMPLTQRKVKSYSNSNKPWISFGIIKSSHRKYSLYRDYLKSKKGKILLYMKNLKNIKTNLLPLFVWLKRATIITNLILLSKALKKHGK